MAKKQHVRWQSLHLGAFTASGGSEESWEFGFWLNLSVGHIPVCKQGLHFTPALVRWPRWFCRSLQNSHVDVNGKANQAILRT